MLRDSARIARAGVTCETLFHSGGEWKAEKKATTLAAAPGCYIITSRRAPNESTCLRYFESRDVLTSHSVESIVNNRMLVLSDLLI